MTQDKHNLRVLGGKVEVLDPELKVILKHRECSEVEPGLDDVMTEEEYGTRYYGSDEPLLKHKLGPIYEDGKKHCDELCDYCNPEQMLCHKTDPPRRIDEAYQTCIDEHRKRST